MAEHVSLVFESRIINVKEELSTHAALCRRGFEFFKLVSRLELREDTWAVVLKLTLGITEALLKPEIGEDGQLGRELAAEALHVLYEVWLVSQTRVEGLWASFVEYHHGWTHLPETIAQWASAASGLASALVDGLYFRQQQGAAADLTTVRIATTPQYATFLDMTLDAIQYAWHRVYQLLGGVNTMPTPGTFSQAMKGLSAVVQIFLSVVRAGCADAPDGNTLLGIFGGDLFEAALQNRAEREEGTATAISTLCGIFTGCARSCFAPRYLAGLYSAVRVCLESPYHSPVLIATLQSTEGLFTTDFAGSRVLVPYYVRAIEGVMTAHLDKQGMGPAAIERYRVTCLGIVARLIGLRNRFQGARFPVEVPGVDATLPPMATYYDLEPHIGFILHKALISETSTQTVCRILWLSHAFITEHLPAVADPGPVSVISPQVGLQVASRFAWTLQTFILKQAMVQFWALDAVIASIEVLASLTLVYEHLPSKEEYASRIVLRFCDIILNKSAGAAAGAATPAEVARVAATAFPAITAWAMTGRWLAAAPACLGRILDTCFACMHAPALWTGSNLSNNADTQEAALQCFLSITNRWGAYPSTSGPERVSSLVSEDFLLSRTVGLCKVTQRDALSGVHYYAMGDNAIVTFVDVPAITQRTESIATVVIVRDRTGKYVWLSQLQLLPEAQECAARALLGQPSQNTAAGIAQQQQQQPRPQCTAPHRSEMLQRSLAERESAVQPLCEDLDRMGLGALRGTVQMVASSKANYLLGNKFFLGNDPAVQPPAHVSVAEFLAREQCKYLGGRMLAAQLGFASASARPALVPIDYTPAFQSALKQLDMQPERVCMSVGVVFQGTGQDSEDEIYANKSANAGFFAFVRSLGWPVKLATHTGFLAGLDRKGATGEQTMYYADHAAELVYHVAPFMSSDADPAAANARKKRLISKDYVLIVWSEDGLYDDSALESLCHDFKIVISPLASGLYSVRTLRSDRFASAMASPPGPLRGTTVVGKCALGPLVRITAMNAYRAITETLLSPVRPFALRQRILADIIRHYRADPTFGALFSSQFFSRSTDAKISFNTATPLVEAPQVAPQQMQMQMQMQMNQQQQHQHHYRRESAPIMSTPAPLTPMPTVTAPVMIPKRQPPPPPSGLSSSSSSSLRRMPPQQPPPPPQAQQHQQPLPPPQVPSQPLPPVPQQRSPQQPHRQPPPPVPSQAPPPVPQQRPPFQQLRPQSQQYGQPPPPQQQQPLYPQPQIGGRPLPTGRPAPVPPPPVTGKTISPPPTKVTPFMGQRPVSQQRAPLPPRAAPPPPQGGAPPPQGQLPQPPQRQGFVPGHRPAPPPPGTQRWVPFDWRKKQQP